MSAAMLHGLGDCTPELNCGCIAPAVNEVQRLVILLGTITGRSYAETCERYAVDATLYPDPTEGGQHAEERTD